MLHVRIIILLFCFILFLSICSCKEESSSTRREDGFTDRTNISLHVILFDLSASLDSLSIETMYIKLKNYLINLDQNKINSVVLYPVHANTARQHYSLFRMDSIGPNEYSTLASKQDEYITARMVDAKNVCDSINQFLMLASNQSAILKHTCFIDAMQSAKSEFSNDKYKNAVKTVVFFGDMIEDCLRNSIDLDDDSLDLYYTEQKLDSILAHDTFLKGVQIKIYLSGSIKKASSLPLWLTDQKLKEFWKYVFVCYGADTTHITYIN